MADIDASPTAGSGAGVVTSKRDFAKSPAGLQKRWQVELKGALDGRKKWLKEAEKAMKRYLGEAPNNQTDKQRTRVNLYHANVDIVAAILLGQVPKVDVSARFHDPDDQPSRVASEALERHLNTDIDDTDDFTSEVKDALMDWLIAGLGQARIRYEADMDLIPARPATEHAPEVPEHEEKTGDNCITEYLHFEDFVWSPARRWKEVRWVAFRAEMTRDATDKRFPQTKGQKLPLKSGRPTDDTPKELAEVWSRVEVWEIWSKEDKKVYWYCEGYSGILDQKDDPMGLRGFFPCPRPLASNITTKKFMPKPDLEIDHHLYDEIDDIAYRLRKLVKQCKVAGAYDNGFPDLARILEETLEGQLVGVKKWGEFATKGGLEGCMSFVPLEPIIEAIKVLTEKLGEKIQLLYQVTGISDIVRGQAEGRATATEQRLKAGFASTRLQTQQDEVSRFATDLQRLRAEVISLHYDPQTIIDRSNLLRVETIPSQIPGQPPQPNMPLINQAIELIKSDIWQYRVEVKSDAIALRDYASLKQERVETIQALEGIFTAGVPMAQLFPQSAPFLLKLGKWLISATKGSQQLEGDFDRFASQLEAAAQQAAQQGPPPNPQLEVAKVKAQAEQGKAQATMQQTQMDAQAHAQKTAMDMQKARLDHQIDLQKLAAQTEAEAQRAALARTQPQGGRDA